MDMDASMSSSEMGFKSSVSVLSRLLDDDLGALNCARRDRGSFFGREFACRSTEGNVSGYETAVAENVKLHRGIAQ